MLKHAQKGEAVVQATDGYATRVAMADNSSLLISQGTLKDERVYTCMVVSESNLREYPVSVVVYSKYIPIHTVVNLASPIFSPRGEALYVFTTGCMIRSTVGVA